jgi:glycosyltransferase involved in cell wall biosynthesis
MKILFAVHGYKPAYRIGGPVLSVGALAERMADRGHDVTVFTTNSNLDEDLDVPVDTPVDVNGVRVWYFRRSEPIQRFLPGVKYLSQSMGFLYAPAMRAELDRQVPAIDVVHTHMPYVYPTFAAARAAIRHGKPLFYHQRGVFDPERLRFRGLKKRLYIAAVEKPIMKKATGLVSLTDAETGSYRALGVDTACHIIPNGVDAELYRSVPSAGFDRRTGLSSRAKMILFMGRIHPIKGAHTLLDAFIAISAEYPNAVLVLAGPDEFGLEAMFRARAESAGLRDRVRFVGMVSGEDKLDWLARADLFALPSDGEGFSMALLEALASGTPLLISPGCHFPEVEASGAGRVVTPRTEDLADALAGMLADDNARVRMASQARTLANEYSWDGITDRMLALYEDALAGRARNAA